jgi:hypothetical protein
VRSFLTWLGAWLLAHQGKIIGMGVQYVLYMDDNGWKAPLWLKGIIFVVMSATDYTGPVQAKLEVQHTDAVDAAVDKKIEDSMKGQP